MARHIACLSFDLDLWSGWTARGMTTPTPVSRGEFGLVGASRILALLAKYGIFATWFIPGVVIDSHEEFCRRIVDAGHEIGHHGYSHRSPASMLPESEEAEMLQARECIRRICGRYPRGYRSPAWDLSHVTVDLLLKHGFDYDSSMMGNDYTPYFVRRGDKPTVDKPFGFGAPSRLIEMPISWSLDDHPHFEFVRAENIVLPGLANADAVLGNWVNDFLYLTKAQEWGALTYTFHPYVIGRGHRMLILERLILCLIEMSAAFMRIEQAMDEFRASTE
jgi:peptidoglycan-N-acetylglucosamine deacetylase